MSALGSNGVFCLKTYTANTYWRLRFSTVVQWVAFSTSTSALNAVDVRQVPKADDPARREFFKKYTKNLDDLVSKDSFMMDFNKLYQKTACAMAFDSAQVRPLMTLVILDECKQVHCVGPHLPASTPPRSLVACSRTR
jgi:hypothetical protein